MYGLSGGQYLAEMQLFENLGANKIKTLGK